MSKQNNPEEWLASANSFLEMLKASRKKRDVRAGHLCFLCEQAAEIAIKGVLVRLDLSFTKTHSIRNLLEILTLNGFNVSDEIKESIYLSEYAVNPRYPGDYDEITKKDLKEAIKISKRVFRWAEKIINDKNVLLK